MSDATAATPARAKTAVVRCGACSALNRVDLARIGDGPRCSKCRVALVLDRPQPVTDGDFQKLIESARVPVLVDFYADWCGPCRMMVPALDAFARQRAGSVLVLKLDTDASPATSQRFGIRSIPTLIAFRDGKESGRHVGVATQRVMEQLAGS